MSFATRSSLGLVDCRGGASWSPADLSGLKIWQESDGGALTDGDGVYQWDPRGGSGLPSFTQATGSKKPDVQAAAKNGLDTILCDGVDDYIEIASVTIAGSMSVFLVCRASAGLALYDYGSIDVNGGALHASPASTTWVSRSSTSTAIDFGTYTDSTWRLFRHACDGTHAGHDLYVNGAAETPGTTYRTADPGTGEITTSFRVGARSGGGAVSDIEIAAIIVACPELSADDAALVETYLNGKWAVY